MDEKLIINNSEPTNISFGVEIQGSTTNNVKARFVLTSQGISYVFETFVINKEANFDLPILRDRVTPGLYSAKLEVVVENERLFTPISELETEIIQPVSVVATPTIKTESKKIPESTKIEETLVKVTKVQKRPSVHQLIESHLEELAQSSNINKLLYTYSSKILLRENFIPLNIKDVLPDLNVVCQRVHNMTFQEYIKTLNKN